MTITLTTATRIGGAVVASGTTDTYDPAIEADLVSRGMATYVSRQGVMDTGVPVTVVSNPLTGGSKLSGLIVSMGETPDDTNTADYPVGTLFVSEA